MHVKTMLRILQYTEFVGGTRNGYPSRLTEAFKGLQRIITVNLILIVPSKCTTGSKVGPGRGRPGHAITSFHNILGRLPSEGFGPRRSRVVPGQTVGGQLVATVVVVIGRRIEALLEPLQLHAYMETVRARVHWP